MPQNLRASPSALESLNRLSANVPGHDELEQQRLSFVMGSLKSSNGITRAQVQEILDQHEGKKSS